MHKKIATVLVLAGFLVTTACTSISTMQSAETTPQGELSHTFGFGQITADVDDISGVQVDSGDANETSISIPMFEYMVRYGFTDSFDMGFRTSLLQHGIDAKYKLIDGNSFLFSLGLGVNYLGYEVYSSGTSTDTKVTVIDIIPVAYFDIKFAPLYTGYLAPKYLHRQASVTGSPDESVGLAGGSVGFRMGKASGFFIEYTFMAGSYTPTGSTTKQDLELSQVSGGFFF